jgi:hypothetical protein
MPHVEAFNVRQLDAVIHRLAEALGHLDKIYPRWDEEMAPLRTKLLAAMREAEGQREYLYDQYRAQFSSGGRG